MVQASGLSFSNSDYVMKTAQNFSLARAAKVLTPALLILVFNLIDISVDAEETRSALRVQAGSGRIVLDSENHRTTQRHAK